ncbi:sensor domain-containing diguanylate cyclase [Mangrovitalea sediminis]|uniref:sensor domain-containing diguanylate cyclase n=1 Tax=Mangrovitalea sediminis TaxID=1982043 RepID=UPI0013045CA3|nr:sensor domain-containing diguanylate cyclase [Mangrovitalea sediminis]
MKKNEPAPSVNLWLQELHSLIVHYFDDVEGFAAACIESGLRMLRLSTGIVSRIKTDAYHVVEVISPLEGLSRGSTFELSNTYCAAIVDAGQMIAYHDVGQLPELGDHPVYVNMGLSAYIGAPIPVGGSIYGTLNFSDKKPREQPFSDEEKYIVESMAALIGRFIERQKKDIALKDAKQLAESIFQNSIVGNGLATAEGTIIDANDALIRTLECSREDIIGKTARDFTHPEDQSLTDDAYARLFAGEIDHFFINKRYVSGRGRIIEGEIGVSLIKDQQQKPAYLILQLIDRSNERAAYRDLLAANARLNQLSLQDGLTGLPNRRAFDEEFDRSLAGIADTSGEVTLVLFDIDHFKKINDLHGHQSGDDVLIKLAGLVKGSLRSFDMAARVGGEEFALILPDTPLQKARLVVERLRTRIANARWSEQKVTCSFGIASFSQRLFTPNALYSAADQALYDAKAAGRNRVHCYEQPTPDTENTSTAPPKPDID